MVRYASRMIAVMIAFFAGMLPAYAPLIHPLETSEWFRRRGKRGAFSLASQCAGYIELVQEYGIVLGSSLPDMLLRTNGKVIGVSK